MNRLFTVLAIIAIGTSSVLISCKKKDEAPKTNATFTFKDKSYSGLVALTATSSCSNVVGDAAISTLDGKVIMLVENMPSAASGSFTINTQATSCSLGLIVAEMNGNASTIYRAISGTLTKTAAKAYTFTGTVRDESNASGTSYHVTATGNY